MTGRVTLEWPEWAIDTLEAYYCLEGGASVQARLGKRGFVTTQFSIRHKASRLDLSSDMAEFIPLPDVMVEAGVSAQALHQWLADHDYRRHCRTWGRTVLLPLPAVRLYLYAKRQAVRPKGLWSAARAADHSGLSASTLCRHVPHVIHAHNAYYRPEDVMSFATQHQQRPPPNYVPLRAVAGTSRQTAQKWLKANGHPVRAYPPTSRAPLYVHADHARAFLSARGHRQEQIETLLRKALGIDASGVKENL